MVSKSLAFSTVGCSLTLLLLSLAAAATQPPQIETFPTNTSAPVTAEQREEFRRSPYYGQMLELVRQRALEAPQEQSLGYLLFASNLSAEAAAGLLALCDCQVISLEGRLRRGQQTAMADIGPLHRYQGTLLERIEFFESHYRRFFGQAGRHMERRLAERLHRAPGTTVLTSPGAPPAAPQINLDEGDFTYHRAAVVADNAQLWSLTAREEVLMVRLYPAQHTSQVLQYLQGDEELLPLTEEALPLGRRLPFAIGRGQAAAAGGGIAPAIPLPVRPRPAEEPPEDL